MRAVSTTAVVLVGLSVGMAGPGFANRAAAQNTGDVQITPFVAHAWCCERHPAQGNTPDLAIDGDITTFTWSTLSFTTNGEVEHSLGLDFGALTPVYLIRLWKENDGGGGENVKNLVIQYTANDATLPLNQRGGWTAVTNLATGLNGEVLNVDVNNGGSVNSDGTVSLDIHNSPQGDGWASLTFDHVMATGIRISFANPNLITFNHYKVYEFQAWSPSQ
jgi:hypothetical protein